MLRYNAPVNGQESTIDVPGNAEQLQVFKWLRKSLIEARTEQYFTPLADVTTMPKHYGKHIKLYHYLPLLDDRNLNDQGIDAAGAVLTGAAGTNPGYGNLYGSSKDIGTINGKLPLVGEEGGRVNRVGFTRLLLEGTIQKLGFFTEFTKEALDFDSDEELFTHISREIITGATKITEDVLQKELLGAAGVITYTGTATADADITGEGANASIVTYEDLMRLSIVLDENRTPKQTKVITGSRMVDTKTISQGRVMYIGSELIPMIRRMVDLHGDPAFVPVHQYAAAGTILNGEIGSIDMFRIVVVPEMLHWAGVGAAVGTNPGYRATDGNYDVYPMLVIGDASFTTIGFASDGKSFKFDITTKMPGKENADRQDPYGETGFTSIKWWYGTLIFRPERIAVVKTVAPL